MGKPKDFLGEGPLTLLGTIMGQVDVELPDFDTAAEWEAWFDELCDNHIVQTSKYGWQAVADKEKFMKDMGYTEDTEFDDIDAESPFEQFFFDLGDV